MGHIFWFVAIHLAIRRNLVVDIGMIGCAEGKLSALSDHLQLYIP